MASYADLFALLDQIVKTNGNTSTAVFRDLSLKDRQELYGILQGLHQTRSGGGNYIPPWDGNKSYGYSDKDTADSPQVPDTLIGTLRNQHPGLDVSPSKNADLPTWVKNGLFEPDKLATGGLGVGGPPPKESLQTPPGQDAPATPGQPGGPAKPSDEDPTKKKPGDADPKKKPTDKGSLATDQQESGEAAKAVSAVNKEADHRGTQLANAEATLADAILNAHADSDAAKTELNGIQKEIIDAIKDDTYNIDTPEGEKAFYNFLNRKLSQVQKLSNKGVKNDGSRKAILDGISAFKSAPNPSTAQGDPAQGQPGTPGAPATGSPAGSPAPAAVDPSLTSPGVTGADLGGLGDSGLGLGDSGLGDLGDLGLGGSGMDPSALASMLPSALSGLSGLASPLSGMGGGGGLSGLGSAAAPFGDLASKIADATTHGDQHGGDDKTGDGTKFHDDNKDHGSGEGAPGKDAQGKDPVAGAGANKFTDGQQQPAAEAKPGTTAGEGTPPVGPGGVTPAATDAAAVTLPDGTSATARTPAAASATKAFLSGTAADAAWRQQGVELPPPGTAVTNPVPPARLSAGMLGMFKDHYVWALSPTKALVDGQVVPLATAASGAGFLGWFDPTATASTRTPVAAAVPAAAAAPTAAHTPVPTAGR